MSNGNVFTDDFRADLPKEVNEFLKNHAIKLVFKHELDTFSNGALKPYDSFVKSLSSLCNPIVDADFVKAEDTNDVCLNYFLKTKNTRKKNRRGKKWSERGHIHTNAKGIIRNNNIGQEYITLGLNALLKTNDQIKDIILLVDENSTEKQESDKVVGFLMTELGECNNAENDFGNVPALNLVCAPKKHQHSNATKECKAGACSVIGRILLFMYLFALKRKKINFALLELAGLYCNLKGLCLYNKFGFREDVSLVEESCFKETYNLAMICKLDSINETELIDALILNKPIDVVNSEPLCDKKYIGNVREQRKAVGIRMENYNSMLDLQTDKVTVEDVEHYINNSLPKDKTHAVQRLGILSKSGAIYKNFGELKQFEMQRSKLRRKRAPSPAKKSNSRRKTRNTITNNVSGWSFKNTSNKNGLSKGLNSGAGVIFHKRRRTAKKKYGW
jgi:hypothetical protein